MKHSKANIFVVAVLFLILLTGCGGGGGGSSSNGGSAGYSTDDHIAASIGQSGGTITTPSGTTTLTIPAGALSNATTITISKVSEGTPVGSMFEVYDFLPNGQTFNFPITISIKYDPTLIPADLNEADLKLAYESGGEWIAITNSTVDITNHVVSGQTTHFSIYAPVIAPQSLPKHGDLLGAFNGVDVFSNGSIYYNYNNTKEYNCGTGTYDYAKGTCINGTYIGLEWECVEFINRYYLQVYGKYIAPPRADAKDYLTNPSARGLIAYFNDGPVPPAPGDILVSQGGNSGHVAIVRQVLVDQIIVAHQNWSNVSADLALNYSIKRKGNHIYPFSKDNSYPVNGWLRLPSTTIDITPPSVPSGLTASVPSSSQINLSWSASTDNVGVVGYKIYRNGTYLKSSATTSASDTGLTPSTQYCYAVSAYDAAGNESSQSTQACASTSAVLDTTPPSIPSGFTASAASSTQINLSWTASIDYVGVVGYKIYKGGVYLKSVASTSTNDIGLSPSTQYCYTVSAYDAAGNESAQSGQSCASTLALVDTTPPSAPSGLSAVAASSSQINLSWSASTDNIGVAGYKIYRNGTYLTSSATTSASDTGLSQSTQYCYAVSAYDAAGNESAQSSSACAMTLATNSLPTTLASGLNTPRAIAVDATNVYWNEYTGGTVKKVGINGGVGITLASGLTNSFGIAVDATSVYWTDGDVTVGSGTVKKVSINGGTVTTLVSGLTGPTGIAVDSTSVYWIEGDGTVKKVGINGGAVTTLASVLSTPSSIAVDTTSVYWTEYIAGTVKKVGINGGPVTILASGLNNPFNIAVDSTGVYWTENPNVAGSGTVKKVSINGGTVTTLASGLTGPARIAVDSTSVYWNEYIGGTVKKVGINGGAVLTLASGLSVPQDIAVDSTSVYWTEWGSGTVKKIAKSAYDTTPPSIPGGLSAVAASSSQINLSWNASTDNFGVAGYRIYRGGVYLKSVTTTSTSDTGLSPSTQYCYTVSAYDASGNESGQSGQSCATTLSALTPPTIIARYLNNLYGIAVDATSVYVTNLDTGSYFYYVDKFNKNYPYGGVSLATGPDSLNSYGYPTYSDLPYCVVVDATSVYWTEYTTGAIKKVDIAGGPFTILASGLNKPFSLAIDATSVYFTENNYGGTIKKVGINGGPVTTLASGLNMPYNIAIDATSVYWTEGGAVKKVGINGGPVTILASGLNNPFGIAIDTASVYWTEVVGGTVKKVGINGGPVTTLASGLPKPYYMAVDATSVYWTDNVLSNNVLSNNGEIKKVGINGGPVTTLASGLNMPYNIAIDATSVYWTGHMPSSIEGVVMKLQK